MFTPIHRALGLDPSPFAWTLVQQAVADGVKEDADLDWKESLYHSQHPAWREEAAKDIAAMANSGGGWIIFGVKEAHEQAAELTPLPWGPPDEQRLRQVAYSQITPAVVGITFHQAKDPDSENCIVGMQIPTTREAPHFARKSDALRSPQRDGPHTVYMSERDIERAYQARFNRRAEWHNLLADLQADALALTDFTEYVGALAVAAPREEAPFTPALQSDPTTVLTSARSNRLYTEATDNPCLPHASRHRTGYRSTRFVDRYEGRTEAACTLHHSGAVSLTMRIGTCGLRDATPDTAASHWVYKSVADFISLVVAHARSLRHSSTYGAVYELKGPNPFHIAPGSNHGFLPGRRDEIPPIHRFVPIVFEVDPQATHDDLRTLAQTTALDVVNQGGLSHLYLSALQGR